MHATTFTPHSFKIDQQQAQRHLEYLGYKSGKNVYLRFFYHSDDFRKNDDKGRKLDRLRWNDVERYQRAGRGVYVVVNGGAGGGHEDKDIKQCIAIFCEWDDRPVEDQLLHWETVRFLEPTFTIYSGDKSAQPYWVFDQPISVEQWRELQLLLIEVMGADPSNKNPSRVFRLAGGWHVKPSRDPVRTEIVQESGKKYSAQQMLEFLREIKQQQQPQVEQPTLSRIEPQQERSHVTQAYQRDDDIAVPVPESVPLEVCLSKDSRQLLEAGVSEGGRNTNGAKLARDLIGTANYLQSIGQRFSNDPRRLLDDYSARCTPPLDSKEVDAIWKSAESDRPTPSCKADGVETCVRAWYWNNHVKTSLPTCLSTSDATPISQGKCGGSGAGGGTPPTVTAVSLRDRVLEILNRNHSPSERKAAFIELGRSTGCPLREVEQLAEAIESEVNLTEGRAERTKELESLLSINDRRLTLARYLHPHMAQPLEQLGVWMGVDAEALLTVLLPTSASLLHPETRVIVKECIDFIEPMVFYTGIVSESGNRKSPTFKAIMKALRKLQDEEEARHQLATQTYKAELQRWKQNKSEDKGEPPEQPAPPREYFADNITSEALDRIKAQQPGHGILIRKDELSGLFGSYGAYKNGRGSDKEGVLSGWNGDGIKVNRAGGSRLSLSHDASSIVGAIQPGKLRKIMGDLEDEQGEWGRFLWYFAPLRPFRLPDDDTRFEVGGLLEGIYRKLDKLAPVQYRFTPDAQRVYQDWHWELEERKYKEPRQGMRAAIAKMQGYTARIAGILHILWATAAGEVPLPHIPIERVKAAKELVEFYLGQVQLIHSDAEAARGELTPILDLILKKARQLGQLPTRIAKNSIKALKTTKTDRILEYFQELTAMRLAVLEGKTLIPQIVGQIVDHVDPMLAKMLTTPAEAANTGNTSLQPIQKENVDLVDHVDHFRAQVSTAETVEPEPLNNSQQSQQVNILDESLTESGVDHVDQRSTSGSTFSELEQTELDECESAIASATAETQKPPPVIAPNEIAMPPEPIKVGNTMIVDLF